MKSFREWLLEKEAEAEKQSEKETEEQSEKDYQDDKQEEDSEDDEETAQDQDDEKDQEQPERVFPKIKKDNKPLRDPDKVIKKNEKEIEQSDDCDEDEGGDGIVADAPTGTTSADVATVDNKINIVSRSLHKKLKSKDIENSMIPNM